MGKREAGGPPVLKRNRTPTQKPRRRKRSKGAAKWWVSTVVLTFFPTVSVAFMSLLRGTPIDMINLIGNGELILSSFLIVTSTLFDCYNAGGKHLSDTTEIIYYGLIIIDALELIAYTTIRTSENSQALFVYVLSGFFTVTSIVVSRMWKRLTEGECIDDYV